MEKSGLLASCVAWAIFGQVLESVKHVLNANEVRAYKQGLFVSTCLEHCQSSLIYLLFWLSGTMVQGRNPKVVFTKVTSKFG